MGFLEIGTNMLRDTLVNTIALKLGERDDLTAAILAELLVAQEFRLEQNGRFQPWFMVTTNATISTTTNESKVVFPSDFVCEVEESALYIFSTLAAKWIPLEKGPEDKYENIQATSGVPEAYSVLGNFLQLFPTPNAVYQLRWKYAAKQAPLITNITNNWLTFAADLLMGDVGEHIAKQNLQNDKLAAMFAEQKKVAWDRLYTMHESRQHTNRQYSMDGV